MAGIAYDDVANLIADIQKRIHKHAEKYPESIEDMVQFDLVLSIHFAIWGWLEDHPEKITDMVDNKVCGEDV